MPNIIKLSGDRPMPFLFCSKNYALSKYGTFINGVVSADQAFIDSSYPAENMIDGNRASYCQMEKIGKMSLGGKNNFIDIKFDISATGLTSDPTNQIDFIVMENDPAFPMRAMKVTTYTDANFSLNAQVHSHSYPSYFTIPIKAYNYGVWPSIDGKRIYAREDQQRPDGFDGRFVIITLDDPITYDRPYVLIEFRGCGRNIVGWDGTFNDGLWASPVDEYLQTIDPINDYGTNDNHIEMYTDSGSHAVDQYTRWIKWSSLDKCTYMLQYSTKRAQFSGAYGYKVEVGYWNESGTLLGTGTLTTFYGLDTVWTLEKHFINYFDPSDAKRKSGATLPEDVKHEVPAGTKIFGVRFLLEYDVSYPACAYKIDDISIHNITTIPAKINEIDTFTYADTVITVPKYRDLTGICKVRRIGFHQLLAATSKVGGALTPLQDLSGKSAANPTRITDSETGKTVVRNFNGRIMGQFIPRSGTKVERLLNMVGESHWKNFISDLDRRSEPFCMIDPQGNFSDFIISPGSINWNSIDQEQTVTPERSAVPAWKEAPDFFWEGTFILKEV